MFGKILIVDDSPTDAMIMQAKLEAEYYDTMVVSNAEEAIKVVENNRPDLIMLDVLMPGMTGFDLCKKLKSSSDTFYLPIICVTSITDKEEQIMGLDAGADDIVSKPIDDVALFARVNSLLRLKMMAEQWIIRETALQDKTVLPTHLDAYFGKQCKFSHIMVVADTDEELIKLKTPLKDRRYKVIYTKSIADAESFAEYKNLDLFVVSLSIGKEEALRFSTKLKTHERNKNTPILIVGEDKDHHKQAFVKALEIGCNDYLVYPLNEHEYLARAYTQLKKNKYQQQLEKNYQKSLSLASVDDLTGVANRRFLYSYLENIVEEMKEKDQKLSVLMMDVDKFKTINDTYGHLVGDEVLIEFSKRLKNQFRDFDLISRYGGDEFIAVIPYVGEILATEIAERVRKSISDTPFKVSIAPYEIDVKISIGLSITDDFSKTAEEIIESADKSLYEAKRTGRDKVCIAGKACKMQYA